MTCGLRPGRQTAAKVEAFVFTGLIETTGRVLSCVRRGEEVTLHVAGIEPLKSRILLGDSIAVSGVCLTVASVQDDALYMDVSAATLTRTTLRDLHPDDEVNLETALTPMSKLGGHLVTGHVDGVGEVTGRERAGASVRLTVTAPHCLSKYIAEKGSICIDGVSLTVNSVRRAEFDVNIIPHTLQVTTLKRCTSGTHVNLEVDLVARYLERLLLGGCSAQTGHGITREFLARHGFLDGDREPDPTG
jgi:riboflavin synthase